MAKYKVNDLFLYRSRYIVGYTGLIALFICLLLFAGLYVPGGLSSSEVASVVRGESLDFKNPDSLTVVNLPYFLVQHLSINTLGISNFSIKLPSLICAFITGIGAVLLLRRWFKSNIAVLATAIMVTTGQFLFIAQLGTPGILYIMWSVWLLLAASMITGGSRFSTIWKAVFLLTCGLSLYTPLSLYLLVAILSAALLHPHVRFVLKRLPTTYIISFVSLLALFAAPLVYLIAREPQLGLQLLGAPTSWPPDIASNALAIVTHYFAFFRPTSGTIIAPIFGLGSLILIVIGAWRLVRTSYTARSYTVAAWFVLLIPVILINPDDAIITFVPFLLLLASGLDYLLGSWYKIFPRNPYARIAGLVPLVVLVGSLLISGVNRYFYSYHYDPQAVRSFTRDLTIFNQEVKGEYNTTLLVSAGEKPFYDVVARHSPGTSIVTSPPNNGEFAATRSAHSLVADRPVRVVTSSLSSGADRFYIYKLTQK